MFSCKAGTFGELQFSSVVWDKRGCGSTLFELYTVFIHKRGFFAVMKVDLDGSGGISFDEFVTMMQLGEMETDFAKEINEAFKFFDKDGDGEVRNYSATWISGFFFLTNLIELVV